MPDTEPQQLAKKPKRKLLRFAERFLLVTGVVLCCVFLIFRGHSWLASNDDLNRFEQARGLLADANQIERENQASRMSMDTSLWSEDRITAYHQTLEADAGLPLAVLEIPAIRLEVPVFEGTSELILNRAIGHIKGTALPGVEGNIAIAGHRDGFFRGLKDLDIGDRLILKTLDDQQVFTIQDLHIVDPEDVYVLDPSSSTILTLVTCYPFYFVGKAPQRFIVKAGLVTDTGKTTEGPEINDRELSHFE